MSFILINLQRIPSNSVIMPNYNHALFIKQRIESVPNQSYQDFELIILDDCSSDNSREIIAQYRQNPKVIRIIYNQHKSGCVFKQWINGVVKAKGEFIWIVESDDLLDINLDIKILNNK